MNKTPPASMPGNPARIYIALLSSLMLAIYLLAPNMPRPSVAFPFLLGAVFLYYFYSVEGDFRAALKGTEERWFLASLFGFSGYLFLNSTWSLVTLSAIGKSVFVILIFLVGLLISRALARQPREALERAAHYAVIGCMIGTLIACFEFSTDHTLARMLYTTFPSIRGGDKTLDVLATINGELVNLPQSEFRKHYDNTIIRVTSAALNRNLSLLLLLFWPALFLANNHSNQRLAPFFAGFIAVAAAVSIFIGQSQTAQIALILSTVAFFFVQYFPGLSHKAILSAWCIAVLLALPLAAAPYKYGLHKSEWISPSFRDRMIIWDTTVEQAIKTPWLGIGIRSTRVRSKEMKKTQVKLPGDIAPRRLGLHTHNQFLQVWFELGAIGAFLMLAIGIGLLNGIRRMGDTVRPYAYAAFVTACVVAAFGWGLWQTWLLSGYGLSVMLVRFISAYSDKMKVRE
jgi:O-antigen ligase